MINVGKELTELWGGFKMEFSPKLALWFADKLLEIKTERDYNILLRIARAKVKTATHKTLLRTFNRLAKQIFVKVLLAAL